MYTIGITCEQIIDSGRILSYVDNVLVYRKGTNREQTTSESQDELDGIGSW